MKPKALAPGDPVIREIRSVRERLWKEGGGTVKGLMKVVDRVLAEHKAGHSGGKRRMSKRSRKAG